MTSLVNTYAVYYGNMTILQLNLNMSSDHCDTLCINKKKANMPSVTKCILYMFIIAFSK